ncbi:HutD family protein [Clostridium sp.]|uniref:HutD/Ves family protein n=1 Tax=Clostridium sp. TaxID=1506 RepID=UPI00321633A8
MSYKIKLIKKDKIKTSTWSGGTTNEIYIYPECSNYKDLNFNWRISSATVDIDHSTFTTLPNIHRFITTLEGNMSLSHDNGDLIHLKPFQVHEFSGEVNTESFGKVKDFNLMLGSKCEGSMKTISLAEYSKFNLSSYILSSNSEMYSSLIFCPGEDLNIKVDNDIINLLQGDTLLVHGDTQRDMPTIEILSERKCNIINVQVKILK